MQIDNSLASVYALKLPDGAIKFVTEIHFRKDGNIYILADAPETAAGGGRSPAISVLHSFAVEGKPALDVFREHAAASGWQMLDANGAPL